MRIITDLHLHSRYSRACSKALTLPNIAAMCGRKGIACAVTSDCTHPAWREQIGNQLELVDDGIFALRRDAASMITIPTLGFDPHATRFLLGTELSCIYKKGGKVRRVHHLVIPPSLAAVDRIIAALEARGCNLHADGRPILGLSSEDLLTICLEADARTLLIPAHAWTPWFAIFGSESGFDAIAECFGDLSAHVAAIETGLSSDPAMNGRVSALDHIALISSSDAHSLEKLGREATVFELPTLTHAAIVQAVRASAPMRYRADAPARIVETIEFFPEEGKYHVDGHRACGVRMNPAETKRRGGICPQCAKPVTVGVMHRVDKLADRTEDAQPPHAPSFRRIVPLTEIIAEAFDVGAASKRVVACAEAITRDVGSEFHALLDAPLDAIARASSSEVAEAVRRVRAGELDILPGYDGEFGTVRIFSHEHPRPVVRQHALFS